MKIKVSKIYQILIPFLIASILNSSDLVTPIHLKDIFNVHEI